MFVLAVSGSQSNAVPSLQALQNHILRCDCYLKTQSKMDRALKANFKGMKENFLMNCFSQLWAVTADITSLNASNLSELRMMAHHRADFRSIKLKYF